MTDPATTFHVRRDDDDGTVLALVRLRTDDEGLHGEAYQPGVGWVTDPSALDVLRNGQDYDLVEADEASALAAAMLPEP